MARVPLGTVEPGYVDFISRVCCLVWMQFSCWLGQSLVPRNVSSNFKTIFKAFAFVVPTTEFFSVPDLDKFNLYWANRMMSSGPAGGIAVFSV